MESALSFDIKFIKFGRFLPDLWPKNAKPNSSHCPFILK